MAVTSACSSSVMHLTKLDADNKAAVSLTSRWDPSTLDAAHVFLAVVMYFFVWVCFDQQILALG